MGGAAGSGNSNSSSSGGGGDDKRMSKPEVLDLATRRIRALEVERDRLLGERTELLRGMEVVMAGAAVARDGGPVAIGVGGRACRVGWDGVLCCGSAWMVDVEYRSQGMVWKNREVGRFI
jgi:hypothetical protein